MNAVEVVRGDVVESRHLVHVAVCDEGGRAVARIGDVSTRTWLRSAVKPMQALPLVEEGIADRLGLTDAELAVCCASHQGEDAHVAAVRGLLDKAGVDESLLRCGPHPPFAPGAAAELIRAGREPGRIHNNCSGKHAGMLALAVGMGWDLVDYHRPDHPVQRRMALEVARWTGLAESEIPEAVDGCGVVCFAVPLDVTAAAFARFAVAAGGGRAGGSAAVEAAAARPGSAARIVRAMTDHPFMVGGTGRTCTDVMEAGGGRVFVKVGAEGVYAGGVPAEGIGFAIKIADGGRRAVEVALLHVLAAIGVFDGDALQRLRRHACPPVLNSRGERVGEVRPAFDLSPFAASGA